MTGATASGVMAGAGVTPTEEVLTSIWERVLGRGPIAADASLFGMGGSWLDAARAAWLVGDAFGVEIGPAELAQAPTPAEVAQLVESRRLSAPEMSATGPSGPVAPVAVSQEGMLWHERLSPGSFNLAPLVRRHRGHLDLGALGRAFEELVRRHESLRSNFEIHHGRPVQVVRDSPVMQVPLTDLAALGPPEAEAEARRLIGEVATQPFRLDRDPLFQPSLIRLGPEDHLLVVRLHHTVFDDWSVDVYRRELSALYASVTGERPSGLPELIVSFSEFARRQRRRLAGPVGAAELSWWRSELAGAPLTTQLDLEEPGKRSVITTQPVSLAVPAELAGRLRAVARHGRATLFMTMLAAFQVLLHRRTGQDDLLIASVVANRSERPLEGLIGCFTKKIPLRLRLEGDPTFLDLVGRARGVLLGALAHQELSFETVLQEVLGPDAAAHGVVPYLPIMFQGIVPARNQVHLPGLAASTFGSDDTQGPGRHLLASEPGEPAGPKPVVEGARAWGVELYPGTFLGLSVVDDGKTVTCVAQGGFHRPIVEAMLEEYQELLRVVADSPLGGVTQLVEGGADQPDRERFRGFPFDRRKLEATLCEFPGTRYVTVGIERVASGVSLTASAPRIVAAVASEDGMAPSLSQLRTFLWSRLPGTIWPAELVVDASVTEGSGPLISSEEAALTSAWAEVLGVEDIDVGANYWQSFSFLEALTRVRETGTDIRPEQVARNRTIETLAADLAASRMAAGETAAADVVPQPVAAPAIGPAGVEIIRAEGLSKTYPGGLNAVEGLDLSVYEGEIFGLLGPNGAGKSTTVGMITTRVVPTAGRAVVSGVDVVADPALAKQLMGVVPQANNLDHNLTVFENLYFHGRYFGLGARAAREVAEEALERFRLIGRGDDRVEHLSGGMARRLLLARALMQRPRVVFLDEPTAGLDPQSRLALWDIIAGLHAEGQTILLTTHYMEEADRFCDRVAIMDHGRILALDSPERLKASLGSGATVMIKGEGDLHQLLGRLAALEWAKDARLLEGGMRVSLHSAEGAVSTLLSLAQASGVKVSDFKVSEDSLETVFVNLTGRELRE